MRFLASLHQLSDWGLLALRVGVGMSFWVHGTGKRAMWKMAPSPQMPAGLLSTLRLLSIVEPLGAVAAFAGVLTQPAAAGFVIIMLGAIRLKAVQMHRAFGVDGGWELDVVLLTAALALVFLGAGAISLDRLLFGL
jgi:putative oxidoreductase